MSKLNKNNSIPSDILKRLKTECSAYQKYVITKLPPELIESTSIKQKKYFALANTKYQASSPSDQIYVDFYTDQFRAVSQLLKALHENDLDHFQNIFPHEHRTLIAKSHLDPSGKKLSHTIVKLLAQSKPELQERSQRVNKPVMFANSKLPQNIRRSKGKHTHAPETPYRRGHH